MFTRAGSSAMRRWRAARRQAAAAAADAAPPCCCHFLAHPRVGGFASLFFTLDALLGCQSHGSGESVNCLSVVQDHSGNGSGLFANSFMRSFEYSDSLSRRAVGHVSIECGDQLPTFSSEFIRLNIKLRSIEDSSFETFRVDFDCFIFPCPLHNVIINGFFFYLERQRHATLSAITG